MTRRRRNFTDDDVRNCMECDEPIERREVNHKSHRANRYESIDAYRKRDFCSDICEGLVDDDDS